MMKRFVHCPPTVHASFGWTLSHTRQNAGKNFLNEPETWDLLERVRALADKYGLTLLAGGSASYNEKTYEKIAARGYMTYDFFLPGLIIDALERQRAIYL